MWKKYKRRVLLAMSSQAFAQLVRSPSNRSLTKLIGHVFQNGINGKSDVYVAAV
jgi:hypothetical protein